ncbi:hypothetical protein LD961_09665, partial [Salmonella enterica]|nr:hypothetical protein [Salmonella enterica]
KKIIEKQIKCTNAVRILWIIVLRMSLRRVLNIIKKPRYSGVLSYSGLPIGGLILFQALGITLTFTFA